MTTLDIDKLSEFYSCAVFPASCKSLAGYFEYLGLTKRELFAAMAMQGAMHALAIQADRFEEDEPVDPHPIARDAVKMADALLKELAK